MPSDFSPSAQPSTEFRTHGVGGDACNSEVVLFHSRTPKDVTDFLRDFHNKWTDALGKSFLSVIMESREHNLAWLAHAKLHRITAANCGKGESSFAAKCWQYVCLCHQHPFGRLDWIGRLVD